MIHSQNMVERERIKRLSGNKNCGSARLVNYAADSDLKEYGLEVLFFFIQAESCIVPGKHLWTWPWEYREPGWQ